MQSYASPPDGGWRLSSTAPPEFGPEALTTAILDTIYCATSTHAQVARATGCKLTHEVMRYLHKRFQAEFRCLDIHAGEWMDAMHALHFDVIP